MSLYLACRYGNVELAEQLIANGADVDWRNPLMVSKSRTCNSWSNADILWSFMFGTQLWLTWAMVIVSIDTGWKNVFVITWSNVHFSTLLFISLKCFYYLIVTFNLSCVTMLALWAALHYCWYFTQGENTPVFTAANHGHVDMLNMLIEKGGDVNIGDLVSLYTIHVTSYFNDYSFNC